MLFRSPKFRIHVLSCDFHTKKKVMETKKLKYSSHLYISQFQNLKILCAHPDKINLPRHFFPFEIFLLDQKILFSDTFALPTFFFLFPYLPIFSQRRPFRFLFLISILISTLA